VAVIDNADVGQTEISKLILRQRFSELKHVSMFSTLSVNIETNRRGVFPCIQPED
jgi:hypothetical protein